MRRIENGNSGIAVAALVDGERHEQAPPRPRARRSCARLPSRPAGPSRARRPARASRRSRAVRRARRSCPSASRRRSPGIKRNAATRSSDADRQVHEEHPSPAGPPGRARRRGTLRGRRPGRPVAPHAPSAVLRSATLGERGRQDRERCGHHHRRADPLGQPRADQHPLAPGEARGQRGRAPNTAVPATSSRRRPIRSAARPPSSMKPP